MNLKHTNFKSYFGLTMLLKCCLVVTFARCSLSKSTVKSVLMKSTSPSLWRNPLNKMLFSLIFNILTLLNVYHLRTWLFLICKNKHVIVRMKKISTSNHVWCYRTYVLLSLYVSSKMTSANALNVSPVTKG